MSNLLLRWAATLALVGLPLFGLAHGDEPHGDAPHPGPGAASATPRFEAATESFEMVGRLEGGVFTLFLQRFETSEPIAGARVEVESGDQKAEAAYAPDSGSYIVNAPALLQALAQPGTHPIIATVVHGAEADLLEGTLAVTAPPPVHGGRPATLTMAWGGAAALISAGVGWAWVLRKRRATAKGRLA